MASAWPHALEERLTPEQQPNRLPWGTIVWFLALLAVCYAPVLVRLVREWITNEDMGHGFFVPAVAAYMAWLNRQRFFSTPASTSYAGLGLVVFAAAQLFVATLGAELFLARTALVFSIIGAVWFLNGTGRLKTLAFPLVLLFFMIPLPAIVYNQITFPLQLLASRVAETVLMLIGIPVLREGNILELAESRLSVVEACSGIRSLLSLSFLALVYGYFFDQKPWMKWVLLFCTIPIAITANAGRVTITGILTDYRKEWAEGIYHTAEGWVIFMIALMMLIATHYILNLMYRYFRHAQSRRAA